MRIWLKRAALILGALLLLVLLAAVGGGIWLRSELRASLPQIDGTRELPRLQRPVVVERDAAGVPTLTAESFNDVARALGFVHASDRYFQMDLLRRSAAGELSALIGPGALPLDRRVRLHRFRSRARRNLGVIDVRTTRWIASYTEGINAGLAALGASPRSTWRCALRPSRGVPKTHCWSCWRCTSTCRVGRVGASWACDA